MCAQATDAVAQLEPRAVWQLFADMAQVPRPSKHEEKIQAHVRRIAEQAGFAVRQDNAGNIVIDVPASPGCENAPITVLQGHLDMVCEKNTGTEHDFENDPIRLILDQDEDGGQIVRADGTTLGADNGIGVALAFAAATDPNVKHGPLELLCTADEEMGMTGAKALEPDFVRGRRMINLDSEEDGAVYIGCAGGMDTNLAFDLPLEPRRADTDACQITVAGLKGGHSGGDIHLNRGNAIKILVRTLLDIDEPHLHLVALDGGSKRNAIPREATAVVAGPTGLINRLKQAASAIETETREATGEACTITIAPADATQVASADDTQRVLTCIAALPHGVLAVVPQMPDLVQTSNSTSTVATAAGQPLRVTIGCLSRSSLTPELHQTARQIAAVGRLAGVAVESGNEYPGWAPDADSPTLATVRDVYEQLFGETPHITAIHAGLECGLIGERMGPGQMDMVSFGPRIEGAHSPDERVWVTSVQKSYDLLKAVLAALAK
jgi:dipeptidase D